MNSDSYDRSNDIAFRWRRIGGAALALVLLAVLPYLASLGHPLLGDDRTLLDNSWLVREASAQNVFEHHYWHGTRHATSDLYRPLTILSLAWNLRGTHGAAGVRGVNVASHAIATLTVCWMLACVFRRLGRDGERAGSAGAGAAAWMGAALFAVHPLASESVLFATGRAEILAAIFGLAAFAALIRAPEEGRGPAALAGSTLLFGLALLFKESAASWIGILIVWWLLLRAAGQPCRLTGVALTTWGGVAGLFLMLRASVVGWLPASPPWVDNPLVLADPVTRSANAVVVGARYLAKMVVPHPLSAEYGYDQIPVLDLLPLGLPAALIVLALWIAVAIRLRRLSSAALFLWVFVPAAFAVTGNALLPIGTIFAERLAYLPLVGLCGLAGFLLARLPATRSRLASLVGILLLVAAGLTWNRTGDFRNKLTFDEAAMRASPRAVKALFNAGRTRLRVGRSEEGIRALERAIEIWPEYPRALSLLGDAHARRGDLTSAEEFRRRAREAQARLDAAAGP